MKMYEFHKLVAAGKILNIVEGLLTIDGLIPTVEKGTLWISEKKAEIGGYFVEYEDGYHSYSSADVFEEGYSLRENQKWETQE